MRYLFTRINLTINLLLKRSNLVINLLLKRSNLAISPLLKRNDLVISLLLKLFISPPPISSTSYSYNIYNLSTI
jgi:hypothetical protein